MEWWWGAIAVVVVGAGVVFYGWWSDRRKHQEALTKARQPTREIPGLNSKDAPGYVTEADLQGLTLDPLPDDETRDEELIGRREDAATLPAGAASGAFLNRADKGLAILTAPGVLVLDDDLMSDRDTVTLLAAAKARPHPTVLVAPYFAETVLATLRANAVTQKLRILPIALEDAPARRRAIALTGARLVPAEDLQAGWLPAEAWGTCDAWIADLDDSWILVAGRDTTLDPRLT